jgi:hypothetical protein
VLREPTPVLFPSQKTWQWVTENILTSRPDLLDHYAADASWRGSLWTPEIEGDRLETTVPRLPHIPLVLFEAIREKRGPLMPHEILAIVLNIVKNSSGDQDQAAAAEAWKLAVMWCVMAVQADQQGDSIDAFAVEAITENNDAYLWPMDGESPQWHYGEATHRGRRHGGDRGGDSSARSSAVCSGAWQRDGHGPSRIGTIQITVNGTRRGS